MKKHRNDAPFPAAATATLPNRARGAQLANENARKHGTYARDAGRIDRRRTVDRRVLATVEALEDALGPRLTPQRALIVANIGRRLRDLARIEAYVAELGTVVHKRRRDVLPIVEKSWKLLDSINRDLERLGLDVEKIAPRALGDHLADRYGRATEPPDALGDDGEPDEPTRG